MVDRNEKEVYGKELRRASQRVTKQVDLEEEHKIMAENEFDLPMTQILEVDDQDMKTNTHLVSLFVFYFIEN